MSEIKVECYSGYQANQRPIRFALGCNLIAIEEIEDQWYSPSARYFRVRAGDGNVYVLRYDEEKDRWTLDAFRKG
jgi:hypothetical protein